MSAAAAAQSHGYACCADADSKQLCTWACVIQVHPVKELMADCPACQALHSEPGFEDFDSAISVREMSITRDSLLPMAMKTLWSPSQLESHYQSIGAQVGYQVCKCIE